MTVQPNIVCDYYIGNTRIKIADNYTLIERQKM